MDHKGGTTDGVVTDTRAGSPGHLGLGVSSEQTEGWRVMELIAIVAIAAIVLLAIAFWDDHKNNGGG